MEGLHDALEALDAARLSFGTRFGGAAPIRPIASLWPASSRAGDRPSSLDLVGDHRRDRERPAGTAFSSTAGLSVSALGTAIFRVYIDARTIPSTPRSCMASISCCSSRVALGLADEEQVAAFARGVERAPDQVAGEGRGGDRVGDEADRVARAGAKAPRDDVRPVAGLANGPQDACLDVGGDPHLLAPAGEDERRRGLRDAGAPGDVGKGDAGVPGRLTDFTLSASLDKTPSESDYPTRANSI